jgi:hypothetical protein
MRTSTGKPGARLDDLDGVLSEMEADGGFDQDG